MKTHEFLAARRIYKRMKAIGRSLEKLERKAEIKAGKQNMQAHTALLDEMLDLKFARIKLHIGFLNL